MVMGMKKKRIYLDTSAISFYYAEDAPEKMAATRKFFDQELSNGKYELCLSALTIEELGGCVNPDLRAKLLKFAYELPADILESTEEITQTGQQLVDDGVIPAKYQDDGLHLAFALLNGIDYIASWNFKHIVKPKTKAAVRAFAIKEGYKLLEIITPEEVAENGDEP
jgi:predicted nucleic acid-binding protein